MTGISRVDTANTAPRPILGLPVRFQNCISPAPAEPNGADLVRSGGHPDSVDEAINDRLGNALAMLCEPRPQGSRNESGILGFIGNAQCLLVLQVRLDVVKEGDGQGVALVHIGDVGVEAGFGVFIREETGIGELPAEDSRRELAELRQKGGTGLGTIDEENDGLGFGVVLGGSDVALKPADRLDAACRFALVHHATETTRAHSNLLRHFVDLVYK